MSLTDKCCGCGRDFQTRCDCTEDTLDGDLTLCDEHWGNGRCDACMEKYLARMKARSNG